jgi:ABC-type Na+ efflux pump permease subunit
MSDEAPRFVTVRHGLQMKITPANRAGWIAFVFWMLAQVPFLLVFVWIMTEIDSPIYQGAAIAGYIVAIVIWFVAMLRWMKARSEVIDVEELLAIKRERDRRGR